MSFARPCSVRAAWPGRLKPSPLKVAVGNLDFRDS